ncbi:MAG: hypothetical protein QM539_09065 [Alphaproteobacteria bacterium]|nr:hypothetical protein [Alphaproteobacteria bacterium]
MKEFLLVIAGEYQYLENDDTILFECKNADNIMSILKIPRTYKKGELIKINEKVFILLNSEQVELFIKQHFG